MTTRRRLLSGLAAAGGLGAVGAAAWWVPRGESADTSDIPEPPALPPVALAPALASPGPLRAGGHRGMNLAHLHQRGRGYGTAASAAQLRRLADLGLTHVALTPFGYVGGVTDTTLRWGPTLDRTLTDAALLAEARAARAVGLQVTLKPHLWSMAFWTQGRSRQDIRPARAEGGWPAWFAAYTAFAEHYAGLAQQMDAALYVVGLEYLRATVDNPGAWADVAAACRRRFGGPITYAANWWREVELFADWAAFDHIGCNAYPPLSTAADPTEAELVEGWRPFLQTLGGLARRHGKDVLLCEAGLPALRGAAATPWDRSGGAPDPALQARAVRALLRAAPPQPWLSGLYWWKWFTDAPGEDDPYGLQGQPAEAALRAAWAPPGG